MTKTNAEWIRTNLEQFGLADLTVTARGCSGEKSREVFAGALSDLCGVGSMRFRGIDEFSLGIYVDEGPRIGYVDSDNRFRYTQAPNLRSALGWALATDGGRVRAVALSRPLDELCDELKLVMRHTSKRTYFDLYHPRLAGIFDYENGSRFGDGYCGVSPVLWSLGTRENGLEHPGYPFMY